MYPLTVQFTVLPPPAPHRAREPRRTRGQRRRGSGRHVRGSGGRRGEGGVPVLVEAAHGVGPRVAARDVEERHEGLVEALPPPPPPPSRARVPKAVRWQGLSVRAGCCCWCWWCMVRNGSAGEARQHSRMGRDPRLLGLCARAASAGSQLGGVGPQGGPRARSRAASSYTVGLAPPRPALVVWCFRRWGCAAARHDVFRQRGRETASPHGRPRETEGAGRRTWK